MVQAIIPLGYSATQAEIDAGVFNAKSGGTIQVVNSNGQPTGVQYDVGATGNAPTQSVTGGNINTILQAAGGAGWEKAQATAASYAITRPTSGASLDLHIETGGTLAAMLVANWPIPAAGVDQLRIRNMSAIAQSFTVSGFSGLVTADGNAATSGSYSIPVDMAVHITIDEDGWVQVAPMGQEVSQAEFDAGLALKAPLASPAFTGTPTGLTKTHVGLGSVDNTADTAKPVSIAQQTALDTKITKTAGTGVYAGTLPSRTNAPTTITTTVGYGSGTGPWVVTISSSLVGVVIGDRWVNNGEFVNITAVNVGSVTVSGPTFYHSPGTETLQAVGTGAQDPIYQVLTKKDVGLTNVDNTADTAKPVSTATQTALDGKSATNHTHTNISVKVTRSTVQSLSSAGTIISWDTVDHEVGATTLWDIATPTRLTAPVAGTYLIVADIAAESDSVGQILFMKNGVAIHNGTAPRFWSGSGSTSALIRLSAGDYIECKIAPAATVNSIVAAERHYLAMVFVSL